MIKFVSPYEKIGGIVWFLRMLQKIRLRAAGDLPADYHPYMGLGFDRRCVRFLQIEYEELAQQVVEGSSDMDMLEWSFESGRRPSTDEVLIWNEFMVKRGWRDTDSPASELQDYKEKFGLGHRADILTYFDFFEIDEGRMP